MTGSTLHQLAVVEPLPSEGFVDWLTSAGISLVLARGADVAFVGLDRQGGLVFDPVPYERVGALARSGATMWVATPNHVWKLVDALDGSGDETELGESSFFLPQTCSTTGAIGVLDIGIDAAGEPILVSSRFSCLARLSDELSFEPIWMPRWVTALVRETRCRLSGVAMRDGAPDVVAAAATTDTPDGWHEHRGDGGVLVDVASDEVIAHGLSVPHSPRWHDGRLWCCDSGRGDLIVVDPATGSREVVAHLPTFLRGLTFVGRHAVVAGSSSRFDDLFDGLPVGEELAATGARPMQGIAVVDTTTGAVEHDLGLEGTGRETMAVDVVPARRVGAVGLTGDGMQTMVSYDASWRPPDRS